MFTAIRFTRPGKPEVLRTTQVSSAPLGTKDVRIAVHAAGINNADLLERRGHYPVPPDAPPGLGLECAGVITEVGTDVTGWQIGDEVCALVAGGAYAEEVIAPAWQLLPVPEGWSFVEAASLPEAACTVYSNLAMIAGLQPGQSALIHGGTGGMGSFAVQWASGMGARVIATAGSDTKTSYARRLGADVALNYRTEDFVEGVLDATDGRGVNAILDIVGAPYLLRNVRCLAPDGHLVTIGGAASTVNFDLWELMSRRASLSATLLRARPGYQKAAIVDAVRQNVIPLIDSGKIRPVVDRVFPLEEAALAHHYLESSETIGKVVLRTRRDA